MHRAGRAVRGHHASRLRGERRVEEQQHAVVVEPEDAVLDLAQPERVAVEGARGLEVGRVDDGLVDPPRPHATAASPRRAFTSAKKSGSGFTR